jgi:lysophospholipase L1-like esterase
MRWIVGAGCLLIGGAASAQGPLAAAELGDDVAIVDPSGRSLVALHQALRRAGAGDGTARLLFYGASHTSSDQFTGYLRRRLQRRFGDAGPGFVLPVRPFAYYDHRGVTLRSGGRWRTLRVRGAERVPDAYGLAGVAVEASSRAWASVEPTRRSRVSRFDVHYLQRPGGGRFEIEIDGVITKRVSSRGRRRAAFARVDVDEGHHRLEIRVLGDGPVRLFGVAVERVAPGVVVDTLGVPGARARDQLPWDPSVLRSSIRRRDPDLVVLAYGTNESGSPRLRAGYEAEVRAVVRRVRSAAPDASCLLMGPSEWPRETRDGAWAPRETTAHIVEVQRRVARDAGCGFFDLVAFQGGPGRMHRWVEAGYALGDHVHYTERGHRRLAEVLERALLTGYRATAAP